MNKKDKFLLIKINVKESFIDNKYILLLSTLLFFVPLFLGYIFSSNLNGFLDPVLNAFKQKIVSGEIKLSFDSIFINNFKAILMEYTGAIFFGLITSANLMFNGLLIGYFGSKIALRTFLAGITPHGIFEIPGLIIGGTAGFVLSWFLFNFIKDIVLYNKDKLNQVSYDYSSEDQYNEEYFKNYDEKYLNGVSMSKRFDYSLNKNHVKLKQSIILLLISTILIVIAAVIETHVTPKIISFFA
ncbi:MAG: stage II sporulation protein M [Methanobrevibacter sp. CfCl-M3]